MRDDSLTTLVTFASAVDSRCELVFRFAPGHKMKVGDDIASRNEQGNAGFDRGDGDVTGIREDLASVTARRP
jgi:hypothetical protein